MISKNELKSLKSLQQKKVRNEERKFIAEGKNSVESGLKSTYKCSLILYTENFISSHHYITKLAEENKIRCEKVSESDFSRIAESVNPQGVLAVFDIPESKHPDIKRFSGPVVYLDNISDPGNMGTILRTCDWFGIKTIIISKNSAEIYNSKTIRSSAGSVFNLHIYLNIDLNDIASEVKKSGYRIIAADLKGENVYDLQFIAKSLIVFSNEASGLSESLLNIIDQKVFIPRFGEAESLNVSSAAAIILSFFKKSR